MHLDLVNMKQERLIGVQCYYLILDFQPDNNSGIRKYSDRSGVRHSDMDPSCAFLDDGWMD